MYTPTNGSFKFPQSLPHPGQQMSTLSGVVAFRRRSVHQYHLQNLCRLSIHYYPMAKNENWQSLTLIIIIIIIAGMFGAQRYYCSAIDK